MHKLVLHTKEIGGTIMHNAKMVGLVAGGAIAAQKFLNLQELATKFNLPTDGIVGKVIEHQGAVKVLGSMAALHFTKNKSIGKNPMFQWAMIGVMVQGTLQEINVLANGAAGQIGAEEDKKIEEEMQEAAKKIKEGMRGEDDIHGEGTIGKQAMEDGTGVGDATNPTTQYPTGVGDATNPTTQYPTGVGYVDDWGSPQTIGEMEGMMDY